MKKNLFLILFVFVLGTVKSQEVAPTLSVGLDQVLFSKGTLDVDLIAKMIAEKQDELKKRIVEKEILEPVFENSPFATKNYVFSVVKNLMNEKDKNVLKKELMEQTVNYTIVYVLAEMYVQLSWDELSAKQTDSESYFSRLNIPVAIAEFNNPRIQDIQRDFLNRAKLYKINSVKVNVANTDSIKCSFDYSDVLIDMMFDAVLNDRVLRSKGFFSNALYFDLNYYRTVSNYHKLPANDFKYNMYRDVKKFVSDVAEWYESFEELAEILENGHGEKRLDVLTSLDKRLTGKIKDAGETIKGVKENRVKDKITALEYELQEKEGQAHDNELLIRRLRESRNASIDNLVRSLVLPETKERRTTVTKIKKKCENEAIVELNPTIFKGIVPDSSFTVGVRQIIAAINEINASIRELEKETEESQNGQDQLSAAIASIKKAIELEEVTIEVVLNLIDDELQRIASETSGDLPSEYDSLVMRLYKNFYFVKNNINDAKNLAYLRWANEELLPEIAYLNLKSKGTLQIILQLTEALNALIETQIYEPILEHFNSSELSHQFSSLLNSGSDFHANYLKFFQRLDELGELETYYYLLNEVLLAYESCQNQDVATAVKLILGSVEKYTSFDQKNDQVNVDVESIILTLAEKYGDRDKNPFNFYMTVGLNNVFAFTENSLIGEDGNSVSNFAFASEKIGVRVNLWNWQMRSKYGTGETRPRLDKQYNNTNRYYKPEPIISNVHFLAYGSGLLYHLTDLGTEKNLNTTFIGTGLGVSFYNKLNFNTSLLFPVRTDEQFQFNTPVLNIGFDVLFIDYINELNKKRKAKKELKDLANDQDVRSDAQM